MKDSDFLTWIADRMVHHYSENEDFDYIHRLRKLAAEAKEREDGAESGYRVTLEYFRESGKWYGMGDYRTRKVHLWEIWEEVQSMLDERKLPGLIEGHSAYHVTIDVPQHVYRHPHLVSPMTMSSRIKRGQEEAVEEFKQDHNIGPSEATLLGEGSSNVTVQSPTTGPFSGEVENTSDTDEDSRVANGCLYLGDPQKGGSHIYQGDPTTGVCICPQCKEFEGPTH